MGFLKRVFGGGGGTHQYNLKATFFTRLRDDAVVQVVGEAYRQTSVLTARAPGPGDLPPGLPPPPAGKYKAMLIPQPTNQFDRNAIAVFLWSGGNWAVTGYLSRTDAIEYQPVFVQIASKSGSSSPAIACDAALIAERGGTGVVLHLGSPGECAAEMVTDDLTATPGHAWAGKVVTFTGELGTAIHGVPLDRHAQFLLARWGGCEILPRVTKKTQVLVVATDGDPSGNLLKARGYGIPIVPEPAFLEAIGIPAATISRAAGRWARG